MTVKKKVATTPKPKAKPRAKAKPKAKTKRKELSIEDKHPFSSFPFRLEYTDGKENRICHFECEEHRTKHIQRYKLRKGSYFSDNLT